MTFDEVINTLFRENATKGFTAKFTPNSYTGRRNGAPYGYYEIEKSTLGGVMIEVNYIDEQEDNPTDMIRIKGPGLNEDLYAFADEMSPLERLLCLGKTSFNRGIWFINSLSTVPSKLTEKEGFLRLYHFKDSEENKQALNKHYLSARVVYDTMHEMMGAKCKFFPLNGGYVIESVFDNGDVETIFIKQTQEYNIYDIPYAIMNIKIPSVGLCSKFDGYTDSVEKMVFRKAKEFINMANNPQGGRAISESETFTRWDNAYINLMAEIKNLRGKAK